MQQAPVGVDHASRDTTPSDAELEFDEAILAHPERAALAWRQMQSLLDERGILFGESRLPTSLKPHFLSRTLHDVYARSIERFVDSLEKLGRELLADEGLFDSLRLPPGSRELLSIDPGYDRVSVICRPDMTWGPDGESLYEVNTDSPAMHVFSDAVQEIQEELFPLAEVKERHQLEGPGRVAKLLAGIVEVYHQWGGTKPDPTIAIVDWPGQMTDAEQNFTARLFTRLGCPSFTCSPHDLTVEGHRLMARGHQIDIVRRRVLFPDFISRRDELEPLLHAYREHLACVINPLRSYILGNKGVLAVLSRGGDWLADHGIDLGSMLPQTTMLDDTLRARMARDRERYVIKGCLGYGGKDVVIGIDVSDDEWATALEASRTHPAVVQEYRRPFTYRLPVPDGEKRWALEEFHGNWNPIVVAGRYVGGLTRVSKSMIVGITARGALLPSLPVEPPAGDNADSNVPASG